MKASVCLLMLTIKSMRRDTYVEQHKNGPKQGKCTHTGLKIPSLLDFIYISSMIEKLKGFK